jgi:hypothetical protein
MFFLVMNRERGLKAVFLSLLRLLYGFYGRCIQACIGTRTKKIAKTRTFFHMLYMGLFNHTGFFRNP